LLDQPHDFYQSLQSEILTLDWSQEFIGSGQRIAHQNSQRRRTIQKNKIERLVGMQRPERFRKAREMIRHPRDLNFGTSKIEVGRHNEQRFAFCRKDSFNDGGLAK